MEATEYKNLYDAVIIGGGPAGLTAALYLARARYRVVVVEKDHFGGQITITSEIVNYPGVKKLSGSELTDQMRRQAQDFGAELLLADVTGIDHEGDVRTVHTTRGDLKCFGILVATGAHPRMIGFEGEAEFKGHGVAYCATCDGEFFTGRPVFVVGGGFAAAEESVFLTKYASHVTVLVREPDFTCAKAVAEHTKTHEKITVRYNTEVVRVSGADALTRIEYRDNQTGKVEVFEDKDGIGVFVFAGYEPATELVRDIVELDRFGYIVTDRTQKTSVDGIYAAGDVCVKNLRQVVTAVGDGALAATELERYAASMQEKTGLHPTQPKAAEPSHAEEAQSTAKDDGLFSEDVKAQLNTVFSRMSSSLVLKVYGNSSAVSQELVEYMKAIAEFTDKLSLEVAPTSQTEVAEEELPCVRVLRADGEWTGLAFHGVPGGHEFTSFVLGLYNAAGPGQSLDPVTLEKIRKIDKQTDLKVIVSLSCTMCPELVIAAQRLAAENPLVTAEVYDVNHFPQLREKYKVMSVPCLVIGDKITFGKKNIEQLLEIV